MPPMPEDDANSLCSTRKAFSVLSVSGSFTSQRVVPARIKLSGADWLAVRDGTGAATVLTGTDWPTAARDGIGDVTGRLNHCTPATAIAATEAAIASVPASRLIFRRWKEATLAGSLSIRAATRAAAPDGTSTSSS